MAQQGIWPAFPDKITGANTTDFSLYLGATKGGKDGHAGYVLCFNANTFSLPAGVMVTTSQASASSAFEPWIVASTSGAGLVGRGIVAQSCPANGLCVVQTAGLVTIPIATTNVTYQAYGNAWAQTNTAQTWHTAALSGAVTAASDVVFTFDVGPLANKFLVNARFVAASATTAVALMQNRSINTQVGSS